MTGSGRGIGLAIALAMARSGMHVQLVDVDNTALLEARELIAARCPDVVVDVAPVSVSDVDGVGDAFDRFVSATGSLDVLVNNAGIAANSPSLELGVEHWQRAVDVNLTGTFVCAQAAGRAMARQRRGAIVNIASMFGVTAAPDRAAYCATKAGVVALTKVLAVEWADRGIRVNAIGPGYIGTELVAALVAQSRLDIEAVRRRTPIGRLGTAEDVANLALFLASDVSRNITGQVVVSDGGWTADGFGVIGDL
ncbi:SDR family NAD(P)-dependent oxidoreductase [Mycobacterium sp. PSTR-4-N]|uniref:SDR family NAD(P)-dependent oxidoreductase n=1 Tax=Mycobacterium sp. PSTR-4-N TaxID=2917745 RepID=UPI001F14C5FA|nr:SDR family oxidoreductase [Mycobacterium sp. PSTR-4-N]MCG7597299.1 SDR family oxidoreductase [Mycobacterium sp. PSTR-4-N]